MKRLFTLLLVGWVALAVLTGCDIVMALLDIGGEDPVEAPGVPAFDFFQNGSTENIGTLGDGYVEFGFANQPYDIQARVVASDGSTSDWYDCIRDENDYVVVSLPEWDFTVGHNTVETRYAYWPTDEFGEIDSVDIWRGTYRVGVEPYTERVGIDRITVDGDGDAVDAVFVLQLQDPDVPYEPTDVAYVMPDDSTGLVVEAADPNSILSLILYSDEYEYAEVVIADNPSYGGVLDIRSNSGALLSGFLFKDEGSGEYPIELSDGAEAIVILRVRDDDAVILTHLPIPLGEDHHLYNTSSGEFTFPNLAGGEDYRVNAIWSFNGMQIHEDQHVGVGEDVDLSPAMVFDLASPVILVQDHDFVVSYQDRIDYYMTNYSGNFSGEESLLEVRLTFDQIVDVLADDTHPLNARTWMALAENRLPYFVKPVLRNMEDFGLVRSDFQPVYELPEDPGLFAYPMQTGAALGLWYNRSFIADDDVPTNTTDLLALDQMPLPTGADAWLAYPEDVYYWLVPWLHAFGGSIFSGDGVTPNLDAPEMENALTFMLEMRELLPPDTNDDSYIDYDEAHQSFLTGESAMIVNGDWARHDYEEVFGTDLGFARLPQMSPEHSPDQRWPAPYSDGFGFYIIDQGDTTLEQNLFDMIGAEFTQTDIEEDYQALYDAGGTIGGVQMPALESVQALPAIDDWFKDDYNVVMDNTVPMPYVGEIWHVWEAINENLPLVMTYSLSPSEAVAAMQEDLP